MINWGTVPAGSVLPFHFGSYNTAGASLALSGLAVTDIEIYKGTTVTQRSSDAGYVLLDTDGIDIDGIAGANGFTVDTGDNTDAGFYAVGSFFTVWVSAVTVDTQTVNFIAGTFRLSAAEAAAGVPKVDIETIKTNPVANGGTVTFPSNATLASTTNITAGTITTATNVTTVNGLAAAVITAASIAASALNGKGDWNIGKTGYALSTAGVQAIWDALTSALTTVGSIGKLLVDNINATISSRSSHAAADVWAVATRILTAGTNIVLAKGTGVTGFNDPSAADNADAVWDEALAGHAGAGSAGEALSAAGTAGDPWTTLLPGAYGAGTAGKIVGDNVNATISSRSSHAAADIWAVATRLLTAGTNIVLAKGVGVTGFNDLSAADIRTALGLGSANLDTQLALASWTRVLEGSITAEQFMRGFGAALLGEASGLETTNALFQNASNTKNVIDATVDADGNRSAVTLDLS